MTRSNAVTRPPEPEGTAAADDMAAAGPSPADLGLHSLPAAMARKLHERELEAVDGEVVEPSALPPESLVDRVAALEAREAAREEHVRLLDQENQGLRRRVAELAAWVGAPAEQHDEPTTNEEEPAADPPA